MADKQQSETQHAEYRAFLEAGELRMQRCGGCGTIRHPARWLCPECLSTDWSWDRLTGDGEVETFVWYFQSLDPSFTNLPYNVAIVRLDEGARVITNVLETAFGKLSIGLKVKAVITRSQTRKALLCFVPVACKA